jgi:hypothetical protein
MEMLDTESSFGEETLEAAPPLMNPEDGRGSAPNLAVRRRIERMRELKRLRELLDDPDFDDLS